MISYHTAVHIEPPVTDEVLLIVESSFKYCYTKLLNQFYATLLPLGQSRVEMGAILAGSEPQTW